MDDVPWWAGWLGICLVTLLLILQIWFAPETLVISLLVLPIATWVGSMNSPSDPIWNWRKDRA
jgi:hypothetical protein